MVRVTVNTEALELLTACTSLFSITATALNSYSSPGKRFVIFTDIVPLSTTALTLGGVALARLFAFVAFVGSAETTKSIRSGTPMNDGSIQEEAIHVAPKLVTVKFSGSLGGAVNC